MHGYRNDELATRWVQLGTFSPIMRLHSTNNPWMSKEPWNYPPEACAAQIEILRFRHRVGRNYFLTSVTQRSITESDVTK